MLKILTINTWKCDGDYDRRMDIMSKQLYETDADIVLLQEVFGTLSGDINTALFLANQLNMHHLFLPERQKKRWFRENTVESFSGLAILSKMKALHNGSIQLPSNEKDGGRSALIASFKVGGQKLGIANIHLTHLKNSSELRRDQLYVLLSNRELNKNDFKVIGGDFNCTFESEELVTFTNEPFMLKDTFLDVNEGQVTFPTSENSPKKFARKIDHLMLLPDKNRKYPSVVESRIALNKKEGEHGLYPSDHFGVLAVLDI